MVGDFNNDGHLDLAVANHASDTVSVLLGNGDGTFQTARNFSAGRAPVSVAVGDFDGDGHLDLAVASFYDGVSVLLGNGDGSFQTARNFPAGSHLQSVAVGDFNADGHLDLAVGFAGGVRVLLGSGTGSFQMPHVSYIAGVYPAAVAVADLNGDSFPDLAVANFNSDGVSILLNDGAWPGPSPPPRGGGRVPGGVGRPRTPPASFAVSWAEPVGVDPRIPAPPGDVNLPLLDSGTAKGWTRAARAAIPASQSRAAVLARAEEISGRFPAKLAADEMEYYPPFQK